MKYFRTKQGKIYPNLTEGVLAPKNFGYEVERYADTIEELCDLFVVVLGTGKQIITEKPNFQQYFDRHKVIEVYGLLDTEQGLIYVAKMNKKKEFELLW